MHPPQKGRIEVLFCVLVQAKTEIAREVKDTLTKSMASFGFMIIETLVRFDCSWQQSSDMALEEMAPYMNPFLVPLLVSEDAAAPKSSHWGLHSCC